MLPPGMLRIQDYPKTVKVWFKETREFPSPCKYYELRFLRIYQQPDLIASCLYGVKNPSHEP
jgi:hypothetical protein